MSWHVEGTYFENCSCDMVCPCSTSGMTAPGDTERCLVALAFHVDTGGVDGLDVGGLTVVLVADSPALMSEGGWRLAMVMDANATEEQAAALGGIFGGALGGPMADLVPLVGEMVGSTAAAIDYVSDGFNHSLRVADSIDLVVEDFVSPQDATGLGIRISGVGFPADTLAAGTASTSSIDVLGLTFDNVGKNSFSAPFAWAA